MKHRLSAMAIVAGSYGILGTLGCKTTSDQKVTSQSPLASLGDQNGETIEWTWAWSTTPTVQGRRATEATLEKLLQEYSYEMFAELAKPASPSAMCGPGATSCSSRCSMELFRPSEKSGANLNDRLEMICESSVTDSRGRTQTTSMMQRMDDVSVTYQPAIYGPRTVVLQGKFTEGLYYSMDETYQRAGLQAGPLVQRRLQDGSPVYLMQSLAQKPGGKPRLALMCAPADEFARCVFYY